MRVIAGRQIVGMADSRGDPGELWIERNGFFRGADSLQIIGTVQSNKGESSGVFRFVARLLDAAQHFLRKHLGIPVRGTTAGNWKGLQRLTEGRD